MLFLFYLFVSYFVEVLIFTLYSYWMRPRQITPHHLHNYSSHHMKLLSYSFKKISNFLTFFIMTFTSLQSLFLSTVSEFEQMSSFLFADDIHQAIVCLGGKENFCSLFILASSSAVSSSDSRELISLACFSCETLKMQAFL